MSNSRGAVSARHVAEAAGVSRAAVSRTFTPGASVSPATRAKVLAAAEQLGYHVNHLARGLTRAETGIVALIAAEVETPFRARMMASLTGRLQEAGKIAMLINTDRSDASVERALRQAISYRTDAAIVLSGSPSVTLAALCARNDLRLVLLNRDDELPGTLHVRLDDAECGAQAFGALRDAGCTRLAVATSRSATASLRLRADGFLAAARQGGIEATETTVGTTSYETGLELGEMLLSAPDRPGGIFCTTDLIACGVIDAARHRFGLRVPEDLSVIGFDDIPQAGWEAYRLTTFAQPVAGICDQTVAWLAQPDSALGMVTMKARLVRRATVA